MSSSFSPSRFLRINRRANGLPAGLSVEGISHFRSGREAVYALLQHLYADKTGTVLLPAWVPAGIHEPFVLANWQIQYYDLDDQAGPKWADWEGCFERHQVDVIVLIHYFGCPQDRIRAESLLPTGSILLEDWAHSYPSAQWPSPSGKNWSLFSPTKWVGTTDGAWLVGSEKFTVQGQRTPVYFLFLRMLYLIASTLLTWSILPIRGFWKRVQGATYAKSYRQLRTFIQEPAPMSNLGHWLICHIDHQAVITKRYFQAKSYQRFFEQRSLDHFGKSTQLQPLIGYPILVDEREAYLKALAEQGIRAQLFTDSWWFIPDHLRHEFPGAERLFEKHLVLPMQAHWTAEDMEILLLRLEKVFPLSV